MDHVLGLVSAGALLLLTLIAVTALVRHLAREDDLPSRRARNRRRGRSEAPRSFAP